MKPYFGEDFDFKSNIIGAFSGVRPLLKEIPLDERQQRREQEKYANKSLFGKFGTYFGYSASWFQKQV